MVHIDASELYSVKILDRCRCGQPYVLDLVLRKECSDCSMKSLYPPDGIKPSPGRIERFFKWVERVTRPK